VHAWIPVAVTCWCAPAATLTEQQRAEAVGHIQAAFVGSGYVDPRVDVLSQNQLIALLQLLPSLSLTLNGNGGGLIDAIVMTPAEGALRIELKGNLAAILGRPYKARGPRKPRPSRCKLKWLRGRATR
jgi:hypothetical protein